jgi:hypothetical protein
MSVFLQFYLRALRYKASDIRQIDSRIHFLKSKLADEEHKNATLLLASEERDKEIAAKNAAFTILQDQNMELKLSISSTARQMRMLEDEIQVIRLRHVLSLLGLSSCACRRIRTAFWNKSLPTKWKSPVCVRRLSASFLFWRQNSPKTLCSKFIILCVVRL